MRKLAVCPFLAFTVVLAQERELSLTAGYCGDPSTAGRIQPGMRPPEIRHRFDPPYPQGGSLRSTTAETVKICFAIDTDGTPSHFSVTSGVDDVVNAAALNAVKQWQYIPAIQEDGHPVKVWVEVPVNFALPFRPEPIPEEPGTRAITAKTRPDAPVPTIQTTKPAASALALSSHGPFIVLDDATPVRLRTNRNLSSADAKTGETVDFEVLEDVKLADRIIIAKGSIAIGTIVDAESKRRMARGGKLDVTIDYVKLADGEKAALRGVRDAKGGGHTGGMTVGIVATSLVFWPAAPLFLFMHGKDITIPKGTEITAYTNGNTTLDSSRFKLDPLATN